MKILIAEDEKNIADGIGAILQSNKEYKCIIKYAENGQEALKIAEQFRPDLLITDIRMYKRNGLELIEELKNREIGSKVIIISGYSNFEYAQKALRMNVLDYLLKPIDKQQLMNRVDQVYKELPESYMKKGKKVCAQFDFFKMDLDKEDFPSSLKKAIAYMRYNYMKELSLQMISDELMLHPNYLSALINRYIGVNLSCILDFIRLEKACELLADSEDMTIAEISYLVGYNNERRLYHAFQKRLNCTPGDFRKEYAGD